MSGRGQSGRGTGGRGGARGVIPGPGYIVPPADLTAEALEHWHDLAPDLARLGLLHGRGAEFLAEYCRLSVRWHEVHVRVKAEGAAMASERAMGGNPALKELLRLNHRLLDLGDRLGMSPMARARMGLR